MTIFDWLYLAASPAALSALAYRRLVRGKYRESAAAMLGRGPVWERARPRPEGSLWLHAVSAGEVVAAKAAAPALRGVFPDLPLLVSTITETGQAAARRTMSDADEIIYFPLDLTWNVRRFMDRFQPRAIALFEAELWPNFLIEAGARGVPVFLLNGRMSDRTYRRHRSARRLLARPLAQIRAFCMQTEADAERIGDILGSRERVFVTGNCKFDADFPTLRPGEREEWLRRLGLDPARPVVVAGSAHPGEEEILLDAFAEARAAHPALAMVLAPRHPERFEAVAGLLSRRGLAFDRASAPAGAPGAAPDVILLDTMGELAKAYGLGRIAVVGGSFVPVGGHNLLEAAAHAVPVIYGPHMKRQPDMLRLIGGQGGGIQIPGPALGKTLAHLLSNEARRLELGERAHRALEANRGAAQAMAEIVKAVLRV